MAVASSNTIVTIAGAAAITSFPAATYGTSVPYSQRQLLLHDPRQPYRLHTDREIPELRFGDLLVEVHGIGLNPIDWKSACVSPRRRATIAHHFQDLLTNLL